MDANIQIFHTTGNKGVQMKKKRRLQRRMKKRGHCSLAWFNWPEGIWSQINGNPYIMWKNYSDYQGLWDSLSSLCLYTRLRLVGTKIALYNALTCAMFATPIGWSTKEFNHSVWNHPHEDSSSWRRQNNSTCTCTRTSLVPKTVAIWWVMRLGQIR